MALPLRGPVLMSTDESVPSVRDLYEAYGRLIGHRYVVHDERPRTAPGRFANISLLEACATRFQGGSARFDMSSNQHGLDLVILSFALSGQTLCYRQRDAECSAPAGAAILHTTDTPLHARANSNGEVMAVALPRAKLGALVADPDLLTLRVLPAGNASLVLFAAYAHNFLALGGVPDPRLAGLIGDQLCDLAALALGVNGRGREKAQDGRALDDARYARAMAYIARHLANPALGDRDVSRHLGLSPSSVRQLFARKQTTVARSIREARVEKAAAMLADPGRSHRKIVTVAFECGFHSLSAFYQAFHDRYDQQPGAFRAAIPSRSPD
ncbi:helix-turn-helix transcriptional regulator [Reyranella sp.]|uniref:helix-turn-helix transcriptional regulator n=1 Tax=Reyranella sp. TaxID=1929291 RepID=UPI003C7C26C6